MRLDIQGFERVEISLNAKVNTCMKFDGQIVGHTDTQSTCMSPNKAGQQIWQNTNRYILLHTADLSRHSRFPSWTILNPAIPKIF